MEELLRARLLGNTALAALVATRIVWLQRPQGASLPGITLQVVSAPRTYTMAGPVGFLGYLVQVDVWGNSYASMKAVARAAVAALHTMKAAPLQAFIENEDETFESQDGPDAAGSTSFYRTRLDVRVWFTPT